MSRLQVGGLALELTSGEVVTLVSYEGDCLCSFGKQHFEVWFVRSDNHVLMQDTKRLMSEFYAESKELLPLGDKQTQEQFKKEECET